MAVFCQPPLDDRGPDVRALSTFRACNRLWRFLRQALAASNAPHRELADATGGWTAAHVYVPSGVCRAWADALTAALPDLCVVSRPDPSRGGGLHPVVLLHRAAVTPQKHPRWAGPMPPQQDWRTVGEIETLSAVPLGLGVLAFATFLAGTSGMTVDSRLPPAPSATFVRQLARLEGRLVVDEPVHRSRTTLHPGEEISLTRPPGTPAHPGAHPGGHR